jgi:hypothetical protein
MNEGALKSWQTLSESPLSFVRRQALIDSLERPVDELQLAALLDAPRFQGRLEARLLAHFRLQPLSGLSAPDDADLNLLLLSEAQRARLPRLCGAVWHAATIFREIRAEVVNEYRQTLGIEVIDLARSLRRLAGAADLLRTPAGLVQAIDRDGAACVGAWLAAQPEPLRHWLELRFDIGCNGGPGDAHQAQIVRSVAQQLSVGILAEHSGNAEHGSNKGVRTDE